MLNVDPRLCFQAFICFFFSSVFTDCRFCDLSRRTGTVEKGFPTFPPLIYTPPSSPPWKGLNQPRQITAKGKWICSVRLLVEATGTQFTINRPTPITPSLPSSFPDHSTTSFLVSPVLWKQPSRMPTGKGSSKREQSSLSTVASSGWKMPEDCGGGALKVQRLECGGTSAGYKVLPAKQ